MTSDIAAALKECKNHDPPLSIADPNEKTHVVGCTLGGHSKCEGCFSEKVMSMVCTTDCLTCLSPLDGPCNEAYTAVILSAVD